MEHQDSKLITLSYQTKNIDIHETSDDEVNDSQIEQVRLTVPIVDDPTLPCLTFRTWVLGITSCAVLSFLNQFFHYRQNSLHISSLTAQILVLPLGNLMATYLPNRTLVLFPSTKWALHDAEVRPKGGLTRLQFFLVVFISSLAYYIVPNYLFPSITALSFVCWIWKDSVTAQIIGAGRDGLGVGSFALDWSTVASFLQSPLATPAFAIINIMLGFVIVVYILTPIAYWTNSYEARRFPIISSHVFTDDGEKYDVSRILNFTTYEFNQRGYDGYSKINLSVFFAYSYGLSFATLVATVSHVVFFHGRIMKKNYEAVPQWWFYMLSSIVIGLAVLISQGFGKQFQLPYWGVLLAIGLALFFTLPVGVIMATTNQQLGLNIIVELIIGYIYPGKPLANVVFKTYGYISAAQAVMFLQDFKLGHYMKVPPKSMFVVQLVGTVVATSVYFGTAWWLLTTVEHICDPSKLTKGSPWTCPGDDIFYNASIIWGVVGPVRMFGRLGLYSKMNYFFLIGIVAPLPVWILSRMFPEKKWIKLVHMPLIIGGAGALPAARVVNYWCWGSVGVLFNVFVYRRYKGWWARHNYILSAGLDAGVAFMAILCYFTLQMWNVNGPKWWGAQLDDHCPLASCPTAPGIQVEGCPVFQ
ncbi:hypothetical protein ES319_D06G253600v1 [Gossypium barbadense]|uniref:Uncharacterized protein n=1 Tax=Gossypium barbadense TaxID=3634 RepID=A0A5J5R7R0_GOSBA|nr:hypothetical protein ES319_D06G253600v1 [Gossypium barbadense]